MSRDGLPLRDQDRVKRVQQQISMIGQLEDQGTSPDAEKEVLWPIA